jgi:tRNA-2-methylthio-N6-dimethylallyladenosine synthase
VEGASRKTPRREGWDRAGQLTGRTSCDRIVVFDGDDSLIGRFVPIEVLDASAVTLFGRVAAAGRMATPA